MSPTMLSLFWSCSPSFEASVIASVSEAIQKLRVPTAPENKRAGSAVSRSPARCGLCRLLLSYIGAVATAGATVSISVPDVTTA